MDILIWFEEGTRALHCSSSQSGFGYLAMAEKDLAWNRPLPDKFWRRMSE